MSMLCQISLCIKVPEKRRLETLSLLRPFVALTHVLPQCISSTILNDLEDKELLWLVEEWVSEESVTQRVKSDAFRTILELMELSIDVPELRFRKCQEMGGLEIVEQARQSLSS